MKEQIQETGGRPWYGDDFLSIQNELMEALEAHFKSLGKNYVLEGCKVSSDAADGYSISAGKVFLDGKIRRLDEAQDLRKLPAYLIAKDEEVDMRPYQDGSSKSTARRYGLECKEEAPEEGAAFIRFDENGAMDYLTALQGEGRRFVKDKQIAYWDEKMDKSLAGINREQARFNLGLKDAAIREVGLGNEQLPLAKEVFLHRRDVASNKDWNEVTGIGTYHVGWVEGVAPTGRNIPDGAHKEGCLMVFKQSTSSKGNGLVQLYISKSDNINSAIYYRHKWWNTASWSPWQKLITEQYADGRYLKPSKNLSDLGDKAAARKNLELKSAAMKDIGTGDDQLVTGALLRLITGDIDTLSYLLGKDLTSTQLEYRLSDSNHQRKFYEFLNAPNAVLACIGSTSALNAIAQSSSAMQAVVKSDTALEILRSSTVAMKALAHSETAMKVLEFSEKAMNALAASETAMKVLTDSEIAMNALADSEKAMNILADSETAMKALAASEKAMSALAASENAMSTLTYSETAMKVLADSEKAMKAMADSEIAMRFVADSSIAMNALAASETAMNAMADSSIAMNALAAHYVSTNALANSEIAMKALAASETAMKALVVYEKTIKLLAESAVALNSIVKSETACKTIEAELQEYRTTVQNTLDNASLRSSFTKHSGINVGTGEGSWDIKHANAATIYIPISCYDDADGRNDNDYSVYSILNNNRLAFIPRHNGNVTISQGVALRGVRVEGTRDGIQKSNTGHVTFDVYVAV